MYEITDQKEMIQLPEVKRLLEQSYWAKNRSMETIQCSMENSLCFGVHSKDTDKLVGFARVITDYATTYYLCDVIVDEEYRGDGIGKALVKRIVEDKRLKGLRGILATGDAHGLYEKYGFGVDSSRFMGKAPEV